MSTPTIPTSEPANILAGSTLKWRKTLAEYPASDDWVLTYKFRGPSEGFDAVASADGDDHLVTVATATTAGMAGGTWYWQGWVSKDSETYPVESGQLEVTAALPAAANTYDGRTSAKKILDAIDAMLLGKASLDQQEYEIGDRKLARIPIPDLIELRKAYAKLYMQEQQAEASRDGRPRMKTVLTRFGTPGA